jgi:hypothetical protein
MDTGKPITDPQPEQPAEQNAAEGNIRHLFDRMFKRAMRLSSPAVIRFINGAFGTSHPLDAEVEYLSTEHITGSLRQSICDMMIGIGQDKYLTEVQIDSGGDMSFRIWNYSYLEGMRNRTTKGHIIEIKLVPAIVIYLVSSGKPQGSIYEKAILSSKAGRRFLRQPGQSRDGGAHERPVCRGAG